MRFRYLPAVTRQAIVVVLLVLSAAMGGGFASHASTSSPLTEREAEVVRPPGTQAADSPAAQTRSLGAATGRSKCLARPGARDILVGNQLKKYRPGSSHPDAKIFNARRAIWPGTDSAGDALHWPVTIRGSYRNGCWSGGTIRGAWDETAPGVTWENPFHHSGGMTIEVPGFLVDRVRIVNHGDGIRPYAANNRIRGAYLKNIHDDCIENDDLHSLTVTDSFLNGCYSAFSARPHSGGTQDGSDNVWRIRNSLVRLEPQPTVYKPWKYGSGSGHGGFFKWDDSGRSPRLAVHNTIFRADQDARHGTLGIPEGLTIESCSNNTIVWLGGGKRNAPFPGRDTLPRGCFTVTDDVKVWDRAVAEWRANRRS